VIGVVADPHDHPIVGEFFELFKTPWELYERGRSYDVVIVSSGDVPPANARLIVVYGSDIKNLDSQSVATCTRQEGGTLCDGEQRLPVYGRLLTFAKDSAGAPLLATSSGAAGLTIDRGGSTIKRLGYDLFQEVRFLLSRGQPIEHAHIPTLDLHIAMLRRWILEAGVALLEIPPAPAGHGFVACLTHDIDFTGIRNHRFDHTMWGFLFRSTIGAIQNLARRRIAMTRLLKMWGAAVSLPLVYLKLMKDFWDPFDWYLRVDGELPATYFVIPFRGRAGARVSSAHPSRRAAAYDIADLNDRFAALQQAGCEIGVHGIDAWHSTDQGRQERTRVAAVADVPADGIRMHWLLRDANTASVLEEAGYTYDASLGYNEAIGFLNGTAQAFRPSGTRSLLELPLHIQDGALFYPRALDLPEAEARIRCDAVIDSVRRSGGVVTVLWHDRSHGPERFWGDFYINLLQSLKTLGAWFGTAAQVIQWFRQRRAVRFERSRDGAGATIRLEHRGVEIRPPLNIRVHRRSGGRQLVTDLQWSGQATVDVNTDEPAEDIRTLLIDPVCLPS